MSKFCSEYCNSAAADEAFLRLSFLHDFKRELKAQNNRRVDFWNNFVQGVTELSLIADDEDTAESTNVTRDEAEEFVNV